MADITNPYTAFRNAHVLVTGGSNGIGTGIARAYRMLGANVTVTGTRPHASDYSTDLRDLNYLQMDLASSHQIDQVAAALPMLDILVNNAGGHLESDNEYDPDTFERSVNINLIGTYRMAHVCYPKLARSIFRGGASIIGLASLASFFGLETIPAYTAAKAAVPRLIQSLAIHWASDGIRVNAVAPGIVASNITAHLVDAPVSRRALISKTPLGRVGQPQDIADAVLFLTSPAASFITGQTLLVDGGYSLSLGHSRDFAKGDSE